MAQRSRALALPYWSACPPGHSPHPGRVEQNPARRKLARQGIVPSPSSWHQGPPGWPGPARPCWTSPDRVRPVWEFAMMSLWRKEKSALSPPLVLHPPHHCPLSLGPAFLPPPPLQSDTNPLTLRSPKALPLQLWYCPFPHHCPLLHTCPFCLGIVSLLEKRGLPSNCPFFLVAYSSHIASSLGTDPSP